ncbi:MAG: hypothetical protein MI923_30515 [Phycisphaerales bacterium]|nr:hypothetical protein [Phycisphaerales bacterium]
MKKLVALGLVVLVGLGVAYVVLQDPVTLENYSKIEPGMSMDDVIGILGAGTEDGGFGGAIGDLSAKVVKWGDEKKSITITFVNKKVVTKVQEGL